MEFNILMIIYNKCDGRLGDGKVLSYSYLGELFGSGTDCYPNLLQLFFEKSYND